MAIFNTFLTLLRSGSGALNAGGIFNLGLFLICLTLSFADSRTVMGLNPWIKPMKFCLSVAAYCFTLSILLGLIDGFGKMRLWLGRSAALMMYAEMACITMQAARGVTSHYNIATGFDASVFALMGICIGINTVLDSVVFGLFVLSPAAALPVGVLWGIRFGLVLFIGAGFEGGLMIMNQAHTVGAADGGPGLPWVNWSTAHGDLRIAHFMGLHGLQILPLLGMAVDRLMKVDALRAAAMTVLGGAYGWAMWWQTKLALAGQPFRFGGS